MFFSASADYGIDLTKSVMIGDNISDMIAADTASIQNKFLYVPFNKKHKIFKNEVGISGEKKPRYGEDEFTDGSMNPYRFQTTADGGEYIDDTQRLQSIVSRYLKNGRRYLGNVCKGSFP